MSRCFKASFPTLLLAVVCYLASLALFARDNQPVTTFVTQGLVPQNLSGSYKGTVYLRNRTNNQYLMVGPATLEIEENSFTLSNKAGKKFNGEIRASIIPEKENLGVGELTFENDAPIEVRWYRDTNRKIFKIVRARGANREFRFCSSNLTQAQCFGRILAPARVGESALRKPN